MITIELCQSASEAFENALVIGAGLIRFDETRRGEKRVWQLNIRSSKQLCDSIPFILAANRLKRKKVFHNGVEQDWTTLFGFLNCYTRKLRLKEDRRYCHGSGDGFNLWGCQSLSGIEYGKHGRWNGKKWIFDKKALQMDVLSQSKRCEHCPAYDQNRIVAIVNALPESVNPVVDSNWCFLQTPVGSDDPIHKVEIARRNCTEIIYSSGVGMTASAIEPIMEMNRSLTRKIPWQVAGWLVINGDLDHEVITPALYEKRKRDSHHKKAIRTRSIARS